LLLSPVNEYLGRRMAIIISIILYTIGAALEAGSVSFGMIVGGRVILGVGVGLEGGKLLAKATVSCFISSREMVCVVLMKQLTDFTTVGTVPVYVAETVERRIRGNLVSLYQFNIALGEVFGYVVAAIFLNVKGNWRYILGSSLIFSTIMFFGQVIHPPTETLANRVNAPGCSSCPNPRDSSCTKERLLRPIKYGNESEEWSQLSPKRNSL
jgi:MFS family permease